MLKEIALKRCSEICDDVAKEPWYKQNILKIKECRKRILQGQDEFETYENLCLQLNCRTEEEIYIAAFRDGMKMK